MTQDFTPTPTIGKAKMLRGRKSAKGMQYDMISGYILHPDTGEKIGITGFVSYEQSSFKNKDGKIIKNVDPKTKEPYFDVSFKFKGIMPAHGNRYIYKEPKANLDKPKTQVTNEPIKKTNSVSTSNSSYSNDPDLFG